MHSILLLFSFVLQIKYLRKFKHLQTLNFSGNPICELEQYKRYVAAFLPQLEYLDYRLIDDVSVSSFALQRDLNNENLLFWVLHVVSF